MHRTRAISTIGISALMLLGCISSALSAELAKVSGTLTYPKGSVLPPNAIVYINLMDVSPLEDNSGDIIARKVVTPSQLPIPFEMEYNPARISSNHTYAILVQIAANHEVLFRNTSAYPVITKGNPSAVQVIVNPVK